jgi:hypothetical protein
MTSTGTVDWVHRRGGDLAFSERLKFIYHGVRALAATKKRMRESVKFRHMEFEDIVPPDSPIAMEAMAFCRETSEPFLFNHCIRSYFWARLLDDGSGPVDQEVLFTALMLHDIGMNEGYVLDPSDKYKCFTIVGARIALEMATRHGWSEKRADLTANAITLHLNIAIGEELGREAALTRLGTGGDVAGLGLDVLHKDQINSVVEAYPRLDLSRKILPIVKREAEERPCCRLAFMHKRLGFSDLIRNSRFTDRNGVDRGEA